MHFIDTNIFLRYFIKDEKEAENIKVENFFKSIVDGQINCFTNTMVINEIIWVLEKYYGWAKTDVCDNIEFLLNTPNIKIKERVLLQKAVNSYRELNIDFMDIYNYFYIKTENEAVIYSFDKHYDRLAKKYGDIERLLP